MQDVLRYASDIRGFAYFGVLIVVALIECAVPRRRPGDTLALRWAGNIVLAVLGTVAVRAVFPFAGLALAMICHERGWGAFNLVGAPAAIEVLATVLLLDLVVYVQHYLLHRVDLLWRLHRTHHTDHEFDLTTGLRFHPLEALYATILMMAAILLLGPPPLGVFIWQILSAAHTFVEHANVRIPETIDRRVRRIFVTPDMHRVHHSAAPGESQANFANLFSFWDRLFGTYVNQPAAGHDAIVFGVNGFEEPKHQQIGWMLAAPFLPEANAQPASPVETVQRPT